MAGPQHRTREYRIARKNLEPVVRRGDAQCVQPVCVMPSRWIPPGAPWDLAHDDSGTVILGPAHSRCNRADGGRRRHRGSVKPARWVL